MTLEDISVLFGDPVEISFEQALSKQHDQEDGAEKGVEGRHMETVLDDKIL